MFFKKNSIEVTLRRVSRVSRNLYAEMIFNQISLDKLEHFCFFVCSVIPSLVPLYIKW